MTTGETLVRIGVDSTLRRRIHVGSAANLAGRLQGLAPSTAWWSTSGPFRLTQGTFDYAELEPTTVKGQADLSRSSTSTRSLVPVRPSRLELVVLARRPHSRTSRADGRLRRVWSPQGAPRLMTISGEPARQVTSHRRLARARSRQDPSPVWRIGRPLPYGDGVGVWAFAEILKSHARVLELDDAETAVAKLDAMLPDGPSGTGCAALAPDRGAGPRRSPTARSC